MSAAVNAPRAISKEAMRMTEKLHKLRNGPGAFELPREIKEIEMTFAAKNRDYGARCGFNTNGYPIYTKLTDATQTLLSECATVTHVHQS